MRPHVLWAALALACGRAPPPLFVECASRAGIDQTLTCGGAGETINILEVDGNGLALADLDGDEDLDLVLVDGSTIERMLAGATVEHHVFLNQGVQDGVPRFTRAADTGLVMAGWPTGISAGDVDRDGRTDLVIGGHGEDALFLNRAGEQGRLVFEKHVLPSRRSDRDWTTSLALADADADGWLDLYLARYLVIDAAHPPTGQINGIPCLWKGLPVMCGPHGMTPQPDLLLMGCGPPGYFRDASEASGITAAEPAFGMGVLFADMDGDGWPDLYVANDSSDNYLFHNRGDGTFEDRSRQSGTATDMYGRAKAGMGVDLGDVDRDGDFDLVISNFSDESHTLFRNEAHLMYRDLSALSGVRAATRSSLGWGVSLADFDADGRLDLFASNGHVYTQADQPGTGTSFAQRLQLLLGQPDGTFRETGFDALPRQGRASACGDLDGDGDLDLVVLRLDGAPLLYLNGTDDSSRQLVVSLGDAPGATLRLSTPTTTFVRQCLSSSGFQSSSDPRLHLSPDGPIVSAQVLWPGGEMEELPIDALGPGAQVFVERGRGVVRRAPLP